MKKKPAANNATTNTTVVRFCAALTLLLATSGVQAAPLHLMWDGPEFLSTNVAFESEFIGAGTGSTSQVGMSSDLVFTDGAGGEFAVSAGVLNFSLGICGDDFQCDLFTGRGGSFSISGTISELGFDSGVLLTGTLMSVSEANADGYVSNVGFNENGGDPLEYLFNVTGGDASNLFGETFGVILMGSGFPVGGDIEFDGDWINDGFGTASIGGTLPAGPPVVPVPAAVWFFGSGLVALFGFARRKA